MRCPATLAVASCHENLHASQPVTLQAGPATASISAGQGSLFIRARQAIAALVILLGCDIR